MSEISNFETHLDRMEREAQAQRHELLLKQEQTKQMRLKGRYRENEAFWVCLGMTILLIAVLCFSYIVWLAARGPGAEDTVRQQEIQTCYAKGWVWVHDKGDYRDDDFVAEHCERSEE